MYDRDRYPAGYRELTAEEKKRVADMKHLASRMAEYMEMHWPDRRETSLAMTKLDEMVMWATKAITR